MRQGLIFMVVTQDDTYRDYNAGAWPDLRMLQVPDDACPGDTIHVICRITDEDNGHNEYMVSYARIILTVKEPDGD